MRGADFGVLVAAKSVAVARRRRGRHARGVISATRLARLQLTSSLASCGGRVALVRRNVFFMRDASNNWSFAHHPVSGCDVPIEVVAEIHHHRIPTAPPPPGPRYVLLLDAASTPGRRVHNRLCVSSSADSEACCAT